MITNDQVVNRAKIRLRLQDTEEHNLTLRKYVNEGAMGLQARETYTIQCKELCIEDCKAILPCNFDSILGFTFNTDECCGVCGCHATVDPNPPNALQIVVCECRGFFGAYSQNNIFLQHGAYYWYRNYFQINGNVISFPSTTTTDTVTLWYRGLNEKDGLMAINAMSERGLSAYAAMQFATDNPESYTPIQIGAWSREWINQKGMLNGKRIIEEFKENKPYISLIVNAVLANKRYYPIGGRC